MIAADTDLVVTLDHVAVPGRLRDVTLHLPEGAWAIVGANGAGKSSLLDLLAGRLRPRSGRVVVAGVAPTSPAAHRRRAYVPQRTSLPGRLRVDEIVSAAARARGGGIDAVSAVVDRMNLGQVMRRPLRLLSGGWVQRVALAAGLVGAPPLWLLDEPATALDDEGFRLLAAWTADHVATGGTVLASAHRAEEIATLAPRTIEMRAGTVTSRDLLAGTQ